MSGALSNLHFSALPQEIRDQIYYAVFEDAINAMIGTRRLFRRDATKVCFHTLGYNQFGLAWCQQHIVMYLLAQDEFADVLSVSRQWTVNVLEALASRLAMSQFPSYNPDAFHVYNAGAQGQVEMERNLLMVELLLRLFLPKVTSIVLEVGHRGNVQSLARVKRYFEVRGAVLACELTSSGPGCVTMEVCRTWPLEAGESSVQLRGCLDDFLCEKLKMQC